MSPSSEPGHNWILTPTLILNFFERLSPPQREEMLTMILRSHPELRTRQATPPSMPMPLQIDVASLRHCGKADVYQNLHGTHVLVFSPDAKTEK